MHIRYSSTPVATTLSDYAFQKLVLGTHGLAHKNTVPDRAEFHRQGEKAKKWSPKRSTVISRQAGISKRPIVQYISLRADVSCVELPYCVPCSTMNYLVPYLTCKQQSSNHFTNISNISNRSEEPHSTKAAFRNLYIIGVSVLQSVCTKSTIATIIIAAPPSSCNIVRQVRNQKILFDVSDIPSWRLREQPFRTSFKIVSISNAAMICQGSAGIMITTQPYELLRLVLILI